MTEKILVLGGVRSGKTAYGLSYARKLSLSSGGREGKCSLYYVATAQGFDEGMQARIKRHQQERLQQEGEGVFWQVIEESRAIVAAMSSISQGSTKNGKRVLLVDCLSIWLGNLMFQEGCKQEGGKWGEGVSLDLGQHLRKESANLVDYVATSKDDMVLISSEVGLGFLPMGEDARLFGDVLGELHQALAKVVSGVDFVVAGLPMRVKGLL